MKKGSTLLTGIIFSSLVIVFLAGGISEANMGQLKLYKKAFPGSKPKCMVCHVDKLPKKADGKNDLNAYGLKVVEENAEPIEETYTTVGEPEETDE